MQSRLRFATAREVFDSFPSATDDIKAEPTDQSPLVFARALADGPTPEDAIGFCAYLLPRREAVWWACQCLRSLSSGLTPAEMTFVETAEAWVREPDDHRRRAALNVGLAGNRNGAATWVALAAGWSGGTMMAGENAVPCPPHLTAKAVRVAVLTGLARISAGDRAGRIRACLEGAVRLLAGPSGSAG